MTEPTLPNQPSTELPESEVLEAFAEVQKLIGGASSAIWNKYFYMNFNLPQEVEAQEQLATQLEHTLGGITGLLDRSSILDNGTVRQALAYQVMNMQIIVELLQGKFITILNPSANEDIFPMTRIRIFVVNLSKALQIYPLAPTAINSSDTAVDYANRVASGFLVLNSIGGDEL